MVTNMACLQQCMNPEDSYSSSIFTLFSCFNLIPPLLRMNPDRYQRYCSLVTHRLLRAWSFQSKLGIISKTIIQAAPQLAHLLFVIFNAIALFALLSYLGLGQRVSYASSYAASFEETFRSLLGLGYVKLHDIFAPEVALSPPQVLLSLIIFYGREVLLVMILMQFFMTTLGAQFAELKAQTRGALASSIPEDVLRHVLPELQAKVRAALGRVSCTKPYPRWQAAGTAARRNAATAQPSDATGADTDTAVQPLHAQQQEGEPHVSAEDLLAFLKVHFPELVSRKAFGDKVPAIHVGGRYLDLHGLQHLFVQLSMQSRSTLTLLQTAPARAFAHQAAGTSSSGGGSSTGASAAVAASKLPAVGRIAVEAGAPAAAVAAALAAAEQLLGSCGRPVDTLELQEARLELEGLGQLDAAGMQQDVEAERDGDQPAPTLQPGRDYTVEVTQLSILLHVLVSCSALTAIGAGCAEHQCAA